MATTTPREADTAELSLDEVRLSREIGAKLYNCLIESTCNRPYVLELACLYAHTSLFLSAGIGDAAPAVAEYSRLFVQVVNTVRKARADAEGSC